MLVNGTSGDAGKINWVDWHCIVLCSAITIWHVKTVLCHHNAIPCTALSQCNVMCNAMRMSGKVGLGTRLSHIARGGHQGLPFQSLSVGQTVPQPSLCPVRCALCSVLCVLCCVRCGVCFVRRAPRPTCSMFFSWLHQWITSMAKLTQKRHYTLTLHYNYIYIYIYIYIYNIYDTERAVA